MTGLSEHTKIIICAVAMGGGVLVLIFGPFALGALLLCGGALAMLMWT